jgi:DNA-binding transcriptional ArsR family regulator
MSESARLFEKISHPTRIMMLKLLERSPMTFSRLKDELGITSSGNIDHHLKKLEGLVTLDPNGLYVLSDEGREALAAVRIVEATVNARKDSTNPQTRWILVMYGAAFGAFWLAFLVTAAFSRKDFVWTGLGGGLIGGAIGGSIGGLFGLLKGIKRDADTNRPLTFWPSKDNPWQAEDWVAHVLFLGGQVASFYFISYDWIMGESGVNLLLLVAVGISILMLVAGSSVITMRTIVRANDLISQLGIKT